jgi:hypothetical protein
VKAAVLRALKAFGRFWWDFLVGDTPEFALATLLIIGVALLLRHERMAATVVLPLLAAGFLLASTLRGRRRAPKETAAPD